MTDNVNEKVNQLELETYTANDVYQAANTQSSGLKQPQVEERQKRYGMNQLKKADKEPIVLTFIKNFTSLMAILLWVGGGIAILSHSLELGLVIWFVNIVNGVFSFYIFYFIIICLFIFLYLFYSFIVLCKNQKAVYQCFF